MLCKSELPTLVGHPTWTGTVLSSSAMMEEGGEGLGKQPAFDVSPV